MGIRATGRLPPGRKRSVGTRGEAIFPPSLLMGSSSHSCRIPSGIPQPRTMEAAQPRLSLTATTGCSSMCETRRLPIHLLSPAARDASGAGGREGALPFSLLQFFRVMNMCVEMGGKEQRRAERERQVNSASKYHCAAHCTHARDVPAQHEFTTDILRLGSKSSIKAVGCAF